MEPYKLVSIIWMASTIYQVAADTEILLKVPIKGETWAWYISPHSISDGAGWIPPSNEKIFFSVCDIQSSREPKNWLRTGFISLNDAKLLEIKMGYSLRNCPDHSTIKNCKTYLDIYALHTNKTLSTDNSEPGLVQYEFVDRITPGVKLKPSEVKEFTYHGKFIAKAKGVYLAFLDQGVCILLQNLTLGYKFCSEKGKDLVTFPRTVAPANDSQVEEKDGKCSDSHSVSEGRLSGVCLSSGEWNITDGVRCLCMKGYELVETEPNSLGCSECPKGSYKNMVNNEKCVECPANSSSDTARTGCICNEGFYKLADEEPCTGQTIQPTIHPSIHTEGFSVGIILAVVFSIGGLLLFAILLVVGFKFSKKRNQEMKRNLENPLLTHGSRVRTGRDIQHLDASEIPPIRTECFEELGRGAFGKVKKAKLKDGLQYFVKAQDWANLKRKEKIVAVKQLHENANDEQRKDFLDEIELMKEVGKHPNVLSFLGCWTTTKPLQLVIEYIPHGDLLHWLRSKRSQLRGSTMGAGLVAPKDTEFYAGTREQKTTSDKDSEADQTKTNKCIVEIPMIAFSSSNQEGDPPAQKNDDECDEDCDSFDSSDLLKFSWQIARGMSYLSEKGLVHRDLAARNILMGHSKRLKIGDFGLMRQLYREVYEGKKQKKLPIKWMAPEAIFDEIFSVKSDVWSYGVVMWEIGTLGGSPYPLLNHTQMLRRLKRGYRMEKPDICSDTFYTLMRDCWNQIPDERPSFEDLVERVEQMLLQEVEYFDMNKLDESKDYYKVQESATAETESENEPEQETAF